MNKLSWLIYLADVCNDLDSLLFFAMTVGVFGFIISLVVWANDENWQPDSRRRTIWYLFFPIMVGGSIFGAIVPSDDTIYAIAASEIGEQVLDSHTGNKAVKALNHWLDKQIGEEQPAPTQNSN